MADQRELTVPDLLDGVRVDKALATLLAISRSQARQLVDRGVTVDGATVGPADKVRSGSVMTSPLPPEAIPLAAEPVDFVVLYEDGDVIVVDKPAGVVTHPGIGRVAPTLAAGLLHRYPALRGVGEPGRWGLVHRLDKDTSGVLLVARTTEAFRSLVSDLRRRQVKRVYLALAHGVMGSQTGTIDAPIGRDPTRPMRRAVTHDGKPARTHYEVLEVFDHADCTLLQVELESGRTHQIRVHLAAIDHPVVGDPTYGSRPRPFTSPRIFLHAAEIAFTHPRTGETLHVVSELPEDLRAVLDSLRSIP